MENGSELLLKSKGYGVIVCHLRPWGRWTLICKFHTLTRGEAEARLNHDEGRLELNLARPWLPFA